MSIESLLEKIKSATDLQSLVRVMKAIAAVNIREYSAAQKALSEYFLAIELGFQAVLQYGGKEISLKDKKTSSKKIAAIIFTADLGLCGQFNHRVISFFQETLTEWKILPDECAILILGEKGKGLLENQKIDGSLSYPGSLERMSFFLQELLAKIDNWIHKEDIHKIFLFYNKPDSPQSYSPGLHRLSPIDPVWVESLLKRKWESRSLPQFTIDTDKLFSSLIQEFFFCCVYKAIIDSFMSENVNRWQSMIIAEKHIDDFMDELKNQYQQLWQDAITAEILDIESGFEALKKKI